MKIGHLFEAIGIKSLDKAFQVLSWEAAQDLGATVGGTLRVIGNKRWQLTLDNLAYAFPAMPQDQREKIALEAWQNAGRIAAEFVKSRHMSKKDLERVISYENIGLIDELLKEKKGIVFNIGHQGNWELAGIDFTARGYPLGVVGRVMKNPYVDEWVKSTRGHFGEVFIPHRNPFFPAVKHLKKNGIVAILIDHNIHEGGIFVPYFNRPAATSTLSGLLAVKLGCPIISVCVQRDGHKLRIRFDGPIRPNLDADPEKEVERLTHLMIKDMERFARARPGEWLWGHNRWKRKPS